MSSHDSSSAKMFAGFAGCVKRRMPGFTKFDVSVRVVRPAAVVRYPACLLAFRGVGENDGGRCRRAPIPA